jgi:hypothetical protein
MSQIIVYIVLGLTRTYLLSCIVKPVLRIRIRMIRISIKVKSWIRILIPIKVKKQDPDPHQSEKVEALEGHFGALEGPIWGKVSGRIRIRIKLKGRIRIQVRIRVKGRIGIRIKVKRRNRIRNIGTNFKSTTYAQCCGSGSGIRCLLDPWTRIRDPKPTHILRS